MEIGISTRCFSPIPLSVDLLERLRVAGFSRIELHANRPAFDYHNKALLRGVSQWFGENELPAPSIHLPFEEEQEPGKPRPVTIADSLPRARVEAMDEIKRCLELADRIAVDYVVLHLGVPGQAFNPVIFDYAYRAIATIQSFSGLRVLIENIPNALSSHDRILEFKAASQLTNVGFCYDTGHPDSEGVHTTSGAPDAIHANDNDGTSDDHLWPFEGKFNWHRFVEQIVLTDPKGPLILEAQDDRLGKAQECRNRLRDLVDECRYSIEEYRLKYKLPSFNHEDA